jgi:hypothetical protein
MLIMQNEDAAARRDYITSKKLGKVILDDEHDDVVSVQYHPNGMKGMVPPKQRFNHCTDRTQVA